ncbi:hypothetical protein QBC42DRAFT_184081 [Cladorrhinum samala]|uniref:Uncharacterized protein n=1 Tax=Cladorrhinum samala TaxID=585594 RepID=A0AAV9HGE5_9PEZI|nr:hypothetical protein QBC42DRAFT_184081 [Cladorrhinum samala]
MAAMARLVLLLGLLQPVSALYWTVTSYYVYTTTTMAEPYGCTESCTATITLEHRANIVRGLPPSATPTSSDRREMIRENYEVVSLYYEPGSVPKTDLYDSHERETSTYMRQKYVVPVTYTAPASCPTPFTVATYTEVGVPSEVMPLLEPTLAVTDIGDGYALPQVTNFVDSNDLPPTDRLVAATTDWVYTAMIADCRNPTATGAAFYGTMGFKSDTGPYKHCNRYYRGCWGTATWVIVLAAVLPSIFLLGLVESFLWFRRLMTGKQALRFGTIIWCLSCFLLFFFTRIQPARSREDQEALRARWKGMGASRKLVLWLKWGFRHKYPVELLGDPSAGTAGGSSTSLVTVVVDEQDPPPVYKRVDTAPPGYGPAAGAKPGDDSDDGASGVDVERAAAPPAPPPAAHVAAHEMPTGHGRQQQQQQQQPGTQN